MAERERQIEQEREQETRTSEAASDFGREAEDAFISAKGDRGAAIAILLGVE